MPPVDAPSIAFLFRYGPAEHAELFHAMPAIWAELARFCTVHCFGMRTAKPIPPEILRHIVWHPLPFTVKRSSSLSKLAKTALWVAAMPRIARRCRALGVRAVYIDETIPLTASLALRHFGPNVAVTVADMFTDIYFKGPLAPAGRALLRALKPYLEDQMTVFITGDFNSTPAGSVPQALAKTFKDAHEVSETPAVQPETRTYHGYRPRTKKPRGGHRIDFIWVTPNVRVLRYESVDNFDKDGLASSDHYPQCADVSF